MFLALLAVVVAAPFERPLLTLPGGFTLTTVEIVLFAALGVIAVKRGPRNLFSQTTPLWRPGIVLLLVIGAAALVAGVERGNAIRFAGRLAIAAALFVATVRVIDTAGRARLVAATMLAVATVVAGIAVVEAAQVPAIMQLLTLFRPGFHVVAGQLRATSTLFYPTIASMYLEVAFAFGLWLLLDVRARPSWVRPVVFIALVIVGAGIAATFTRAGLIGMGAAMVLVAALGLTRAPLSRAGLGTVTLLAAVIAIIVFVSHSPEALATRLTTEGSQAWYGARYEVPTDLSLRTGELQRVPVTVTNIGRLAWDSQREPRFAMAYHWTRGDGEEVVQFDGARTPFPVVVAPDATVSFAADVFAPGEPGVYTLVWDVVHEDRAWLSTEGVPPARTSVTVTGQPVAAVVTTMNRLPAAPVVPPRPALWMAALRIARDHPWLGVGPDNYRHVYGPYTGLAQWDHRVHANNMYLDVLAGAGVPGLLALVWLVASAFALLWRRMRAATPATHIAAAAALAMWVMVAGHALVDSFLSFTTTYVTFAVGLGLACSPGLVASEPPDAHRF